MAAMLYASKELRSGLAWRVTWPDLETPPGLICNTTEVLEGSHKLVGIGPGMEDDLARP